MKKIFYLIIFVGLFLSSCNKNKSAIDVTGIVKLTDQYSQLLPSNGVEVSISLKDKNGTPVTTTTNEDGIFLFKDIPMGTYNFTFKKENHPEIPMYSVQILGHGEIKHIGTITISQISTATATLSDSINDFGWQGLKVSLTNVKEGKSIKLIAYISSDKDVSKDNCDFSWYVYNNFIDKYNFNYLEKGTYYIVIYARSGHGYYDEDKNYVNLFETPISDIKKIEIN